MTARRSNRIAGEKLSDEIGEVERHGRTRFYLDRRAGWETEHADVSCKFTIFDLLPELRTKIYAYAMAKEQPREITLLKTPVLAMVSKQIRAEALPVFFAECTLTVSVHSNYQDQQELDALAARQELPTGPWAAITTPRHRQLVARSYSSGIIAYVEKQTRAMLAGLRDWGHSTTAFRNLELRVHGPVVGGGVASKCETSTMVIRVPTASKPRPIITWIEPAERSAHPEGLAMIRGRLEAKAGEIGASRETFRGFTLEALEVMGKVCKYWPVGGWSEFLDSTAQGGMRRVSLWERGEIKWGGLSRSVNAPVGW